MGKREFGKISFVKSIFKIDITDKINYLINLEMPYFVGVIDEKEQKVTIYSGLYLDNVFTVVGKPKKLIISLHDKILNNKDGERTDEKATIYFPNEIVKKKLITEFRLYKQIMSSLTNYYQRSDINLEQICKNINSASRKK